MQEVVQHRGPEHVELAGALRAGFFGIRSHEPPLPVANHNHPRIIDTPSDVTARATTTFGCPEGATAVDARTTGLIAGADSRNASAAARVTPRFINAADTGTDAHSQPGRMTPDALATGTARAGCLGNAFAKKDAGMNAVRPPTAGRRGPGTASPGP